MGSGSVSSVSLHNADRDRDLNQQDGSGSAVSGVRVLTVKFGPVLLPKKKADIQPDTKPCTAMIAALTLSYIAGWSFIKISIEFISIIFNTLKRFCIASIFCALPQFFDYGR